MEHNTRFSSDCVVGVDLGDNRSHYCVVSRHGKVSSRGSLATTQSAFSKTFAGPQCRIVLEVGSHSRWVSESLETLGHEVIVANPRRIPLIYQNRKKNDPLDAEHLARLGRVDPQLLSPVRHRSRSVQADLARVKARDTLVQSRSDLVNHVRGTLKSWGVRPPKCSTSAFPKKIAALVPTELNQALGPILETIVELTRRIRRYDVELEQLCDYEYPLTTLFRAIKGVGPVTALAYLLTLEDPKHYRSSRVVGAYLGLTPRLDESGNSQPQLRITKAGNTFLRRLLVTSAHYILGPFGEPSDLRRWGLKIAERGGKNAKKRAVVAVARKLAVLLHRLWLTGEVYDPHYQQKRRPVSGPPVAVAPRSQARITRVRATPTGAPSAPSEKV